MDCDRDGLHDRPYLTSTAVPRSIWRPGWAMCPTNATGQPSVTVEPGMHGPAFRQPCGHLWEPTGAPFTGWGNRIRPRLAMRPVGCLSWAGMTKRPRSAATPATDLSNPERVLLFCVASDTEWERAGITGADDPASRASSLSRRRRLSRSTERGKPWPPRSKSVAKLSGTAAPKGCPLSAFGEIDGRPHARCEWRDEKGVTRSQQFPVDELALAVDRGGSWAAGGL
jgi:hypothetical protein